MQGNSDDNKTTSNQAPDVGLEMGSRISARHRTFPAAHQLSVTLAMVREPV